MPSERKRKIVSKSTENASRTIITAQPMSPNKLDEKRELKPDNDHATQAGDSSNQKDVSEEIRLLRILMKKSEKTLFDAIMRMEKSQYSAIHRLERHIETLENSVDNLPSTLSRYIEDDESSPEHRESTPAASPVHTIQTAKGTYPEGDSQWQQPPTPTSYAPSPQGDQAQGHYRNYQQQQQQGYYQPGVSRLCALDRAVLTSARCTVPQTMEQQPRPPVQPPRARARRLLQQPRRLQTIPQLH
ncbi:hypothetical protein BV25DRAFT_251647 [Artomyces pyxidatus]|uniref:Uncharacterized protein n=1 Tax=Artomyces pyxidatus TaxID=48021 RepID=A0ACB8T956_9AGAM|nr:hypothetical protein BV25DRAFT_251647 [Artomyces pyxidatus]